MIRRVLIAIALLAVLAVQTPAQAQWGCGIGGCGVGGYGYYGYGIPVSWVHGRVPPYFALHPPVYYSGDIIRIPYGASPFAYPWGVAHGMPATSVPAEPAAKEPEPVVIAPTAELVMIENQFYKRPAGGKAPALKSQANNEQGQVIVNPYYRARPKLAQSK